MRACRQKPIRSRRGLYPISMIPGESEEFDTPADKGCQSLSLQQIPFQEGKVDYLLYGGHGSGISLHDAFLLIAQFTD